MFTLEGAFVQKTFALPPSCAPADLEFADCGLIYVADIDRDCVRVLSADGSKKLRSFEALGLETPAALAQHGSQLFVISRTGRVYVFE